MRAKLGQLNIRDCTWAFVLAVFVSSRIFFLGVGAFAVMMLPSLRAWAPFEPPPGFWNYWANWDGAWYVALATEGYDSAQRTAFFPFYPLLVYVGTFLGIGPALSGVLVSLVATLFALYFLYRIAEKYWDLKVAKVTVLTFAYFPTAFFLNAVYTEALFVALSAGAVWAAYVRRDLLLAGILGALAAATRNFGLLLLIPLGYEWIFNREEFGWRGLWKIALVPIGLVEYMIFLQGGFKDPFIFARQQDFGWGRALTPLTQTMQGAWVAAGEGLPYLLDPATLFLESSPNPALRASNTLNLAFLVLLIVLLAIGVVVISLRVMPGLLMYAFLVALVPILTPPEAFPLMSLSRYMLSAFPLFLVFGYLLSHSRLALYVWLVLSASLGAALTSMFVTWRWVA
jgi:hypothetical protein